MSSSNVLVISTSIDQSTDEVVKRLVQRGVPTQRFDTERFPYDTSLSVDLDGALSLGLDCGAAFQTVEPSSVWYRRVRSPQKLTDMNPGVHEFCVREARSTLLGATLACSARFMSWPPSVWAAENKVYQLECARRIGLPIPRTVVTNRPAAIVAAFERFGHRMIIKPARSGYVDYGNEQRAVYTNQILEEHMSRIESARLSPAIYQELLDKDCDVRVTIVGSKFFVAEIDSQTDEAARIDWRHTVNPNLPHRAGTLPPAIEDGIRRLLDMLGLVFGAVDLVRTRDGRWYFLEVNPNGQWLWLEDKLGFMIADEIAEWLSQT